VDIRGRRGSRARQPERLRHGGDAAPAGSSAIKSSAVTAAGLTAALGALLLAATPPGGDFPAQVYRAHLFAHGLTLWDSQWYGGHYLLSYSLLTPALAAAVGPRLLALVAAVASSWLFAMLAMTHFGRRARPAVFVFGVAVLADVVVGRTAFALGQALALAALLASRRDAHWWSLALAVLTAAASPVAAALLAIATTGAWLANRKAQNLAVAAAAAAPAVVVALLFPDGGTQPFRTSSLVEVCALVAAALIVLPLRERALRITCVLYGAVCVAAYALPTPLGSNVLRLGMLFGAPLVLAALVPRRVVVAAAVAVPMFAWQASPAVTAIAHAAGDKSLDGSYYTPLLRYLGPRAKHTARIEIPMTLNHWESAFVAPHVALARGWERQLDVRYNGLFYDGHLTAERYRRWLFANGVSYVALPDAPLDPSARAEAALVARGPKFLVRVFRSSHWQVFRVRGAPALASGTLRLDRLRSSGFVVRAKRHGAGLVRVHFSPLLTVLRGNACLVGTAAGWTRVLTRGPGTVKVAARWPPDHDQRCPPVGHA
jgi:hypothetical protein